MSHYDRRHFLQRLSQAGLLVAAGKMILPELEDQIRSAHERIQHWSIENQIKDEAFWQTIRQAYTVSSQYINLNNGGVSPQPRVVQEAVERHNRFSNEMPSYNMWRLLDAGREPLRSNMARVAGCDPEELAFNRNATEALETIIFGLQLQKGDEVILSKQDYPNMKNAWKQRAARDGIVLKWVDLPLPIEDDETFLNHYMEAFSRKTKLIHLTHLINWTGQVIPVAKIAKEARRRGVEVLVDGAHSFAHLDYSIPDLECDYFGTSLHKWLCAPFGSGLLYVKKEKIAALYPLFGAPEWNVDDIRKFEHLGTRSLAIEQAIGQAIIFHEMIGSERKSERLFYLKNYWAQKVQELPGYGLGTSLKRDYSGALALLTVKDGRHKEVSSRLWKEFGIHTVNIEIGDIQGIRITPNVYTLERELDQLVDALKHIQTSQQ